jgi:hypothetical protein
MKQTRETASKEAREIQEKGQVVSGMFKGDVEKFKEEYSKTEKEAKVKINLDHVIAQKTQIGIEIQASVEKIVQNLDEATRKIIEIKGLSAWEKFLSIFGGSGKNAAVRHHLRRVKSQNISENINTTIDFSRYYEQSLGMLIEEGTRELEELVTLRDRLNQDYTASVREAQEGKARLDELDVRLEEKEKDRENALVEDRGVIEAEINRLQDERRELHDMWQQASIRGRLALENYETAKNYVAAFDTSTKSLKAIQLKLQYSLDQTAEILQKTISVFKRAETVKGSGAMFDAYRQTLDSLHKITGDAVEAISAETSRILDQPLNDPETQEAKRRQIEEATQQFREALIRNYDRLIEKNREARAAGEDGPGEA